MIVWERSGRWALALRRDLPRGISLREARSHGDCLAQLHEAPLSFLVVELTAANAAAIVELLSRLNREFHGARAAVVAERALGECEWSVREAGAIHFVTSPRKAAELARLAQRHAEHMRRPKRSLAAEVWDSLPWPEAAST